MSTSGEPSLFDGNGWADSQSERELIEADKLTETWSVGELHRTIEIVLGEAFGGEIWVEGEIRNLKRSPKRHVYFDLVDSDSASEQYAPMLAVTLFDRERQVVNRFLNDNGGAVRIADGIRVRIRGRLGVFASRSSLQLRMTAIDPTFTLGVLDQLRERVLASLANDGLLERNAQLRLSPVPARIALITSVGSAAHADALGELTHSGLGLQVYVLDSRVQGVDAEQSLLAALNAAAHLKVDAILLVRGGGARTDLAAFDLESVARAIANAPVPVITGIGHEIDTSIADVVAHTSRKTPTAASALLVTEVRSSSETIEKRWLDVTSASATVLDKLDTALSHAGNGLSLGATRHIDREQQRVEHLRHRFRLASPRAITAATAFMDDKARRISRASVQLLGRESGRLDIFQARSRAHDPQLALARGWSITRNASGKLLRSVADAQPGEQIEAILADGSIRSVVSSVSTASQSEPDDTTEK